MCVSISMSVDLSIYIYIALAIWVKAKEQSKCIALADSCREECNANDFNLTAWRTCASQS